MAELKTKPGDESVESYLAAIEDASRRSDCQALDAMMRRVTGEEPVMWGGSIVGYGTYHYVYASGREGDWLLTGFASRKRDLTVYIMSGLDAHREILSGLGRFREGKGCLYLKHLSDVDADALESLVSDSVRVLRERYPAT